MENTKKENQCIQRNTCCDASCFSQRYQINYIFTFSPTLKLNSH